jgi:hypothetical protein
MTASKKMEKLVRRSFHCWKLQYVITNTQGDSGEKVNIWEVMLSVIVYVYEDYYSKLPPGMTGEFKLIHKKLFFIVKSNKPLHRPINTKTITWLSLTKDYNAI